MRSKLGFHIDISTHRGQIEKLLACKPAVVKVIANFGLLNELHEKLGDSTVLIAKSLKVTDDFLRYGAHTNPRVKAQQWFNDALIDLKQAPFAYWESFNEVASLEYLEQYAVFEEERQRILADNGFKACILNFSTGVPKVDEQHDDWGRLYPALVAANTYKNILGLHEYGGLYLDMWYGPNGTTNMLNGRRQEFPEAYEEGWLFGRYRKINRIHLQPNGWKDIRIALTEFGLDYVATDVVSHIAGAATSGWKTCAEAWKKLNNVQQPESYYLRNLMWADSQLQKDNNIVGATIFTWGTLGNWDAYELEGKMADLLVDYIQHSMETSPKPPEEPDKPVPVPAPYLVTPTPKEGLRLRLKPNTRSKTISITLPGEILQTYDPSTKAKLGKTGKWLHVKNHKGQSGWSAAWYLKMYEPSYVSEVGNALIGLHGPADPSAWSWNGDVYDVIWISRLEAVKMLAANDVGAVIVKKLRDLNIKFIMARMFAKVDETTTPKAFFDEVRVSVTALYNEGVRYFEVHNEPNLAAEGFGRMWHSGSEFSRWYLQICEMFRLVFPDIKLGFPGLSPGSYVGIDYDLLRYDSETFLQGSQEALDASDFICIHTYWGGDGSSYMKSIDEVAKACNRFKDKLVIVSEFSNTSPDVFKESKGREYLDFYRSLRERRLSNLGAVFSFIVSASSGFDSETWMQSTIPTIIGSRAF